MGLINREVLLEELGEKYEELGDYSLADAFCIFDGLIRDQVDVRENRRIEELGLDNRTYNCLKRGGINTVADLCSKTEAELMNIRYLGVGVFRKLKKKMKEEGLKLRDE